MKVSVFVLAAVAVGTSTVLASAEGAATAVADGGALQDKKNLRPTKASYPASKKFLQGSSRLRAETPRLRHLSSGKGPNSGPKCPVVQELGVIERLDFNPAFTEADEDSACLFVSSFFSKDSDVSTKAPDLVARICNLDELEATGDYSSVSVDRLIEADLDPEVTEDTIWPNDLDLAPEGVFPFPALVVSQGFQPAADPGRLSAINLDNNEEYLIHQSTQTGPPYTGPLDPSNQPRFYHNVEFYDMDGDGLLDIITVRSGFRIIRAPAAPPQFYPPSGELVWFKNPGDELDPDVEWKETVLFGSVMLGTVGPDIFVKMADFDGDGVPEFVATHLFTGANFFGFDGKIALYAAPEGDDWSSVNGAVPGAPQARVKDLSNDQGLPFSIEIVDLNGDGKAEILCTNHQPVAVFDPDGVPGRVYALEQPENGDIFSDWTTHILLDDIRPYPNLLRSPPPGRLAPGAASPFYPYPGNRKQKGLRPWIVVGGDEASKAWILSPTDEEWTYDSIEFFDINDYYGADTTQTPRPPNGITISTIGEVVATDSFEKNGDVVIYVPVFEAQDIIVFRLTSDCSKKEPV